MVTSNRRDSVPSVERGLSPQGRLRRPRRAAAIGPSARTAGRAGLGAQRRSGGSGGSPPRVNTERGSSAVELAVLAPALLLICMLILQFGLWFNARQAALAAAQAGALVAREQAATNPDWAGAAQGAAARYYGGLHTSLLGRLTAHTSGNPRTAVFVTVRGPLGYSVFGFFGLNLTISATAGGPVECFRPPGQTGCG
jgi:TadE-like protein